MLLDLFLSNVTDSLIWFPEQGTAKYIETEIFTYFLRFWNLDHITQFHPLNLPLVVQKKYHKGTKNKKTIFMLNWKTNINRLKVKYCTYWMNFCSFVPETEEKILLLLLLLLLQQLPKKTLNSPRAHISTQSSMIFYFQCQAEHSGTCRIIELEPWHSNHCKPVTQDMKGQERRLQNWQREQYYQISFQARPVEFHSFRITWKLHRVWQIRIETFLKFSQLPHIVDLLDFHLKTWIKSHSVLTGLCLCFQNMGEKKEKSLLMF